MSVVEKVIAYEIELYWVRRRDEVPSLKLPQAESLDRISTAGPTS